MAEAGTPQPDGPRPPTPRPRGDRGRDPAALAAWRRVAEQRRKAGDKATSPCGASTVEPAVAEPPVVEAPVPEPPVVEPPIVERPTAARPALGRPAAATPAADRPAAEPGIDRQAATGEPATDRPAAAEPAADRPAARPAPGRPTAERPGPRPAVDRPAGPRPLVDRPGAQDPATPARPAPTGAGDDLVRAVQDDHAHGEPTRPDSPPAPATARDESAPASSRPGSDGGPAPVGRLHDALLGLAGRLDDDALTSVREMVAAEDDAEAAELLGGCLLAGGIGLTAQERAVLRPWFTAARVDPELLGMLPSDTGALDRAVHRFVTSAPDRAPGVPLARAARRLSGVVAVRESWRVTPAGSAPGPVPHRVVLVETVGPDDCDHVVHHLAHAARALDDTSVEVFAQGAGLPAYHRAALAVARPLVADDATAPPAAPSAPPAAARSAPPAAARPAPSAPIRSTPPTVARPTPPRPAPPVQRLGAPEDEETWRTVADAGTSRTGPAPVAVPPEPTGVEDDADEPEHVDLDEPELMDLDEPEPEPEPADPDEADEAPVALAEPPRPDRTEPARPARPAASDAAPRTARPPARPETSIDEDLSSTARRIAALWARPSPEDFSAPLPAESLEPTHLEPTRDEAAEEPEEPEDEGPSGRHGRPAVADMGTTSFRSPRSRSRSRINGHPVARPVEPAASHEDTARPVADPAPTSASADDLASDPDGAQLPRTLHRGPRDGDVAAQPDTGLARFGHDARFGAGPGPAWPGGPVTGDTRPGPDTLFASPVEVGEEPVSFGTNGHRHVPEPDPYDHEPDTLGTDGQRPGPAVAAADDEPDTGPVSWAAPAGPTPAAPPPGPRAVRPTPAAGPTVVPPPPPGPPVGRPPAGAPRRPGDPGDEVAPQWAADEAGWVPDGASAHAPDPDAASWSPEDDSVAQLSDRERELLARLHEELAQRERSEGADPFAPPRPAQGRSPRPPRPGAPGGRVNGHGLPPGGPDDARA